MRMQQRELLLEDAQAQVLQHVDAEANEPRYLDQQISDLIHGLDRFKADARDIL